MIWPFGSATPPADLLPQLAASSKAERTKAFQALLTHADPATDDLLLATLGNDDQLPTEQKLAIIDLVGRRAPKGAVPALKPMLDADDYVVRSATVKSLVRVASLDALDALVPLLRDSDLTIRQEVREAIVNVFRDRAMASLVRAVPENREDALYFEIVSLMEDLDLFEALETSFSLPDPDAKLFLLPTLAKFHRPQFLRLYFELLTLGNPSATHRVHELLRDYSLAELADPVREFVRRTPAGFDAVGLLSACFVDRFAEDPETALSFMSRLEADDLRRSTFEAVARRIDPSCLSAALPFLADPEPRIRQLAAEAIAEVINHSLRRAADPTEANRGQLAAWIGQWRQRVHDEFGQTRSPEALAGYCRVLFILDRDEPAQLGRMLGRLLRDAPETTFDLLGEMPVERQVALIREAVTASSETGLLLIDKLYPHGTTESFQLVIRVIDWLGPAAHERLFKLIAQKPAMFKLPPLLAHPDSVIRAAAVMLMAKGQRDALTPHLAELAHDPAPEVRSRLVDLLPDLAIPQATVLLEELCADPNPDIACRALLALKPRLPENRFSQILTAAARSPNEQLRTAALREVAKITQRRYIANFKNLPPHVRALAGKAILKLDAGFVDSVLTELTSLDPDTRLRAAMILENLRSGPKVQQALLAGMKDPSRKVRAAIVKTLGVLGDREIFGQLIEFLNDPDPRVRANTIEAIQSLGDQRAVQFLLPYLTDENNRVAGNAAVALWRIGQVNVLPHLTRMLASSEGLRRASALWAIGEIGQAGHVSLLLGFLRDPSEIARANAVRAVVKIRPDALRPHLNDLRKDPSAEVKRVVKELSFRLI